MSKEQVEAYKGLVDSLSSSELEEIVLPHIFRLAKRSPESVLNNSILFLGLTSSDLSSSASKAASESTPLLRHSRDSVRYHHPIAPRFSSLCIVSPDNIQISPYWQSSSHLHSLAFLRFSVDCHIRRLIVIAGTSECTIDVSLSLSIMEINMTPFRSGQISRS